MKHQVINALKRSRCKLFYSFQRNFLHLFPSYYYSFRFDSIIQNLNVLNISKKYFKLQKYFLIFNLLISI